MFFFKIKIVIVRKRKYFIDLFYTRRVKSYALREARARFDIK